MSTFADRQEEYNKRHPRPEPCSKMNFEAGGFDKEDLEDYDDNDNDNYEVD